MDNRTYNIEIDSRILELLEPNLYTNIYNELAKLIANFRLLRCHTGSLKTKNLYP